MKLSQYNKVYDLENNKKMFFNSNTCGLAEIDKDEFESIEQIFDNIKKNENYECEGNEIIEELKKGGFIIENDVNELEILKFKSNSITFNNNQLSITIAPTLKCNFACSYCYESNVNKDNKIINKKEFIDNIKKLIDYQLQNFKIDMVFIGWYGGEPLLEYDFIVEACKQFNEFLKQKNIPVSYGIISNGYYFDKSKAIELKELGFNYVQITIDGTKDVHDKRRILVNGQGTFDRIINNINEIYKYLTINLRVNVDKNNIDNMDEFLDNLIEQGLKDKIGIAFAPTRDESQCCNSATSVCFGNQEFSKELINLYTMAWHKGFKVNFYVTPKSIHCTAPTLNSFLVEPDGTLQRCWGNIGDKKRSIGNLLNFKDIQLSANSIKWANWNNTVFNTAKCIECDILPICMGGCAYQGIEQNGSIPKCTLDKYYFEEKLKFNYYCKNKSK